MALNIDGTTGISGVDGSASAPALQGTDSNTGINFASDTVNINTGGVTRATVDSSGRLLLGDTDSDNAVSDSDNLVIGAASGDNGMTIVSQGGNYNGSIRFSDGSNSGADSYRGTIQYYHGDNYMRFYTDATERMRIDSSGNVGIGVTDIKAALQVNSDKNAETDRHDGSNYHLFLRNPQDDSGEACGLAFAVTSNATKTGAAIMFEREGGGSQGSLQFYTNGDGNSVTERMRIESDGDLRVQRLYDNTTSGGANVRVQSNGLLQ